MRSQGYMGWQLLFDNYNASADIVVLTICIVTGIFLATSFSVRTKTFGLFTAMLGGLFFAAMTDILLHICYDHVSGGNYTVVYVLRVLFHFFLFFLLFLFILYLLALLDPTEKKKMTVITVSATAGVMLIITDILLSVFMFGFHIEPDGTEVPGLNIFIPGYAFFIVIIISLLFGIGDRLYSKTVISILGSILVSFMMLYNEIRFGKSSYTVSAFLFPILSILYLFHSNPYNIDTGTISVSALKETVEYNYSHKRDFYYVCLYLPDFASEGKALPKDLQAAIRQFPAKYFKRSALFQVSNGFMFLMVPGKHNPDCEEGLRDTVRAFTKEYKRFRYNYKLVIGKSIDVISRKNEYLSFIKGILRRTRINSIHMVDNRDVNDFNASDAVLLELEDINAKHDLNDPRVLAYCQPVLNLKTGKYDTAEALMRLNFPGLGMVYPDLFIPIAEENGHIHVLTEIILHKTCEAIKKLLNEGYDVNRISVNVSMHELRDAGFTKDIENIIASDAVPNGKVAIEITESQTDSDFMIVKSMIEELKGTGITFYLDDFGTGFSNLERIMKLPFDTIKFDRSLVTACKTDKRSEEIVRRLAGMLSELDYSVLYEGIEEENDEIRCGSMSASYLQGYRYSRPIPIEELEGFFTKE
ncbi:MAG: EAL domain-containing protein [Lachnospiraceae bacterium]|nr:EAL domain-containing protein [Lachnospiraceae bacterium]